MQINLELVKELNAFQRNFVLTNYLKNADNEQNTVTDPLIVQYAAKLMAMKNAKENGLSLQYKGYRGTLSVSNDALYYKGKVFGLIDTITYQSDTMDDVERSFKDAVDFYIGLCSDWGRDPEVYVENVEIS